MNDWIEKKIGVSEREPIGRPPAQYHQSMPDMLLIFHTKTTQKRKNYYDHGSIIYGLVSFSSNKLRYSKLKILSGDEAYMRNSFDNVAASRGARPNCHTRCGNGNQLNYNEESSNLKDKRWHRFKGGLTLHWFQVVRQLVPQCCHLIWDSSLTWTGCGIGAMKFYVGWTCVVDMMVVVVVVVVDDGVN